MSQATLWFAHGWAYDASFWEPLRARPCPTGPRWPTTPAISAPPPAGSLRPGDRHRPFAGRAAPVAPAAARLRRPGLHQRLRALRRRPGLSKAWRRACSTACCGSSPPSPRRCCAISARAAATTRHPARPTWPRWNAAAGAARRGPARRTGGAAHAGAGAGRRRDPVVPPAMTGAALPGVALRWHARGGHLLPRSDPQWCAGHIRDFAFGLAGIGA